VAVSRTVVRLNGTCVRHIHDLIVGTETEAVALFELVGDEPNLASGGSEAVDLAGEARRRAECLLVATTVERR
jgi:hypothetical protein